MESSFRLEVVTPERVVFGGQVTSLVIPTLDGSTGILTNHAPIVTAIDLGAVTVTSDDGSISYMAVSDGFFEMSRNHARILADVGEKAEDIDLERAEGAVDRANERLDHRGDPGSEIDFDRAELALKRARVRVRLARLLKGK